MSKTSSTAGTGYISCPCFVAHGAKAIHCQGCITDTVTQHTFKNHEEKMFHQRTYCEGMYKKCEAYQAFHHYRWEDETE